MADWDSMDRFITQARSRAFKHSAELSQTLGRAFDFLLRLQKFGWLFEKRDQVSEKLGRVFWSK